MQHDDDINDHKNIKKSVCVNCYFIPTSPKKKDEKKVFKLKLKQETRQEKDRTNKVNKNGRCMSHRNTRTLPIHCCGRGRQQQQKKMKKKKKEFYNIYVCMYILKKKLLGTKKRIEGLTGSPTLSSQPRQ